MCTPFRFRKSKIAVIFLYCLFSVLSSSPQAIEVQLDAGKVKAPVSKLVYGQFIELLFNYFEGGLWSEMIGDRKFFYPVNGDAELNPVNTRNYLGRWEPAGPANFITMDSLHAFTGEHSPRVVVEENQVHGIMQKGFVFKKGKDYSGYIIIAGNRETRVNVSLANGYAAEKQLLSISSLAPAYRKIPFRFTAAGDERPVTLKITGRGKGSFTIGTVSLMPADNVEGFRADIIAQLKDMHMNIIRWGGNASSGYDWRDGIGDRDKRPPRYEYAWRAMESNDVGTDEYLALCRLLHVTPYIGVNAGFGDAYSASQWVAYVNGNATSPMGKLRAANGHPEPYHVQWWGIGNEMYGEWQLGRMAINHYIIKHRLFARAMKKVDPSIVLVASGASPYETGSTSVYFNNRPQVKAPYAYGSSEDWSGNLLAGAGDYFNYLAEHLYPISDSAYDVHQQQFVFVGDTVINRIRRLPNRIKGGVEAYHEYMKRMPFLKDKNIRLAVDEWHLKDGWGLEDALATAEAFHEIFRHSDIIQMAAYTSTSAPSCLLYDPVSCAMQPNGLVMKMYSNYFGSLPIEVLGQQPQAEVKGTKGVDKPFETSGSDTSPIDVSAALTADRRQLTVAVVNPTPIEQNVSLKITHAHLKGTGKKWTLAGNDLKAFNELGKAPAVRLLESNIGDETGMLHLPAYSVTLYAFDLQ